MSTLSDNTDLMIEVITVLVLRLGGSVAIPADEPEKMGPVQLASMFDPGAQTFHLRVLDNKATMQ